MSDSSNTPDASRTQLTLLWTQAQPLVMAYIRSMVHHHSDAEDVLQRTAYDIATHFDAYDPDRPFIAWALGIAKYKVMDYRRDLSREQVVFTDAALDSLNHAYASSASDLEDNAKALHDCLRKLSDKARTLVELRYLQNLKPAEIAQQIGTSANTVSNALSRTRQALRDCISRTNRREGTS